jgi:recombinational DNA repair ATPase RecF
MSDKNMEDILEAKRLRYGEKLKKAMSDTPEVIWTETGLKCVTLQDYQELERERDEARADLEFRRDLFALQEKQLNEVRASLDEIRKRADYNLDLAKKARDLWEECERERDEARNEIEGWRNKWECAVEMAAIAEVKKDEIIQKLKEILNNQ